MINLLTLYHGTIVPHREPTHIAHKPYVCPRSVLLILMSIVNIILMKYIT